MFDVLKTKIKRAGEIGVLSIILMVLLFAGFSQTVFAQAQVDPIATTEAALETASGAVPGIYANPPEGAAKALETTDTKIIKPTIQVALLSALLNLGTFVFDRLAYDAAMAIATGGEGQTLLIWDKSAVDNWAQFGLDVAGEAIGSLSELSGELLDIKFNLCTPEDPLILLALQLSIKQAYQPEEPKCDFRDIQKNWSSFLSSTVSRYATPEGISQTVLETFGKGLRPGNNELSAAIGLNIKVHEQVAQEKWKNFFTQNASDGFQDVRDFLTGTIKTPASTLKTKFEEDVVKAEDKKVDLTMSAVLENTHLISGLFLQAASVFTNTLLSQLLNKLYTGLFDIEPTAIDLSDYEGISVGSMEDAEESFSSIVTTNPISITEYNALSEFVVCPSGGVMNRNLNNCVMDANLAAAIARGETAGEASLTVQEAMDEGLLRGDWPLISPEDLARNQDPYCYTYGYCYGNVIKMRKARIIPVGWEMAALRNSSSNPSTLQEIVDGFDDCDANGNIDDDTHKWCHLIDPNWVLKYPDTQCRAMAMGEIMTTSLSAGRASSCVDTPSCIEENGEGQCIGGYGYCVREKNTWQFRGQECPSEYATCLSFTENYSGEKVNYLLDTVDFSVCDSENAGCEWLRTNQYYNDGGTLTDTSDDSYDWLGPNETFDTSVRAASVQYAGTSRTTNPITYTSDSGTAYTYNRYAYEDRVYFNHEVETCTSSDAGCGEFYEIDNGLTLNVIQNPSFEDDEDDDNVPDSWSIVGTTSGITYSEDAGGAKYGSDYIWTDETAQIVQQGITISPHAFYTLSFYAREEESSEMDLQVYLTLVDAEGDAVDLSGYSYGGDCTRTANVFLIGAAIDESEWTRYSCTFTTADETTYAEVSVGSDMNIFFDAIQLEYGENMNDFVTGYNDNTLTSTYLVAPPDYLGCQGDEDDPSDCDSYAQVCAAEEAGCLLYTPQDGDPSVPAILSSSDECPDDCVGYTTYKQESTLYDNEEFPLYFIEDRAVACTEQYVGCESFTNLSAVETGGETAESYTYLRPCLTEEMSDGTSTKESSTFFTWEGSDVEGYQLRTWQLLESNGSDSDTLTFTASAEIEQDIGQAPCTQWNVTSETTIACDDITGTHLADLASDDTCDQHADIFENPDCREFFDSEGKVHYRLWSQTISVNDACVAYRLDSAEQGDCEDSGGYWTSAGACRYFGFADESTQCPTSSVGCREYTGGAGRNASTVFSDTFEDGDVAGYETDYATSSLSNESIATDGHSLKVVVPSSATLGGYAETLQAYAVTATPSTIFDSTDVTTCTAGSIVGSFCEIDADGDGTVDCSVEESDNACGTLDDKLVEGKTFILSFWAKGNGNLYVELVEAGGSGTSHDFVDATDATITAIALDGSWQLYELGPLDTGNFTAFDDSAVLRWSADANVTFYLDNISLKQAEENITLIKDSWVVPSVCDQTPLGIDADQYYLGCEAYTDSEGEDVYAYQFSDLCSEDAVGCKAFYDTQESDSEYTQVFNARCENHTASDPTDPVAVSSTTNCVVDGVTYCAITTGRSYCLFDLEGALLVDLPSDSTMSVVLGPEAVVVANDTPRYLIESDEMTCSDTAVGCQELGLPTYSQDKTEVTEFTSTYFINDPESYGDILCDDEALFCEAWTSTEQGTYYYKDPVDQTCTYETEVTVGSVEYSGWFRSDAQEPCYWTDVDSDGAFTSADTAYLISGTQAGIWRNGDDAYVGWVAECKSTYDLCSEFVDPVDVAAGLYEDGMSYYYLDDEELDESTLRDNERCNGKVSQKEGCALFLNTTDSELSYNASASYVASAHADEFFSDEADSLQDPIDCEVTGGGVVTAADGTTSYDLCARRCVYTTQTDDAINSPMATAYTGIEVAGTERFMERSCYVSDDCIDLQTTNGETVTGVCTNMDDLCSGAAPSMSLGACDLTNDTNTILKVDRDRACAAWLSCSSSQVSWDETSSIYQTICNDVSLCSEYTAQGDSSFCDAYISTQAEVLTPATYARRDTSWNGWDYAGYAIPQQLPIEHYGQFNIAPTKWCVSSEGAVLSPGAGSDIPFDECSQDSDCASGTCEPADDMYRLSYIAGTCDIDTVGTGGTCYIGACADDGSSCSNDDECDGSQCVVGYCQVVSDTDCSKDADCTGVSYGGTSTAVCDTLQGTCVDALVPNGSTCVETTDCSASAATCTLTADTYVGSCFNEACLTDIRDTNEDGIPDPFDAYGAREKECRGYPEATSPYSATQETGIVESWINNLGNPESSPETGLDSRPYTLRYGFQSADVCAPITNTDGSDYFATDDCTCSYKKASYSDGAAMRYYPIDYAEGSTLPGVCLGGDNDGLYCDSNDDCSDIDEDFTGICGKRSQLDTYYGWEGYCLEKDTSIQIFGSSEEENRACLTWLPVDQLVGSTDLYGKYTEAGYDDGDTYYCAEIDLAYNITTTDWGCAESYRDNCNGTTIEDLEDAIALDGDCAGSVVCPNGFFGVMTGCHETGWDENDDGNVECTEGTDDDCPFFCVPKASFHTETDESCLAPEDEGLTVQSVWSPGEYTRYVVSPTSNFDFDIYLLAATDFDSALSLYSDCEARGVTEHFADFYDGLYDANGISLPSILASESGKGYYDFDIFSSYSFYPTCTNIVQVSQDADYLNKAWTGRDWLDANDPYEITGTSLFAYPVDLLQAIFGKSLSVDSLNTALVDPQPASTVMCIDPTTGDYEHADFESLSCSSGAYQITDPEGYDAWPYSEVEISYDIEQNTSFCKESDCSCSRDTEDEDCNDDGSGVPTCHTTDNTCNNGPLIGEDCESDADCIYYSCLSITYQLDRHTSSTVHECGRSVDVALNEVESSLEAIDRLAQIFAKSYDIYQFSDGYVSSGGDTVDDLTISQASELDNYGIYTSVDLADWSWDITRGDDDYTTVNPEAPEVYSVGDCSGTVCEEGEANAFSVNEQDQGEVQGADGNLHATARFYTSANEDQMPIRTILVDWADDETHFGTYSGSTSDDNFYKNHRGVRDISNPVNQCSASADTWDLYSDACDNSYVAFTHDYVCNDAVVSGLASCDTDEDGNVTNSPCVNDEGACVFRPRVFVQDNWGWCTGVCEAGLDGTSGCYEDNSGEQYFVNECDWENCPGGTRCEASEIDPWVYFDGEIVVEP